MKLIYIAMKWLVLSIALLVVSCVDQSGIESNINDGTYKSKLLFNVAQSVTRATATENDVQRLDILFFKEGKLEKLLKNITSFTTTDSYSSVEVGFDTEGTRTAYIIANIDEDSWLDSLVEGTTTIDQITSAQTANLSKMANPPLVMYGISENIPFSATQSSVLCQLYRVVARIDIENTASNFTLTSARLINSKVASNIFPVSITSVSEVKDFELEQANGSTSIRLYSYGNGVADSLKATKVEIAGTVNDKPLTYTVDLAQEGKLIPLERNNRYTINILDVQSNNIHTVLTVAPWKVGNDIDETVGGDRPVVDVVIAPEVGTFTLADSAFAIKSYGGQILFNVKANAECQIDIQGDWLLTEGQTRAASYIEGRFVVNATENITEVARTATIQISNKISKLTKTFTLTQDAAVSGDDKYMVVVVAGQSNAVGYDESAVSETGVHAPNPNAFQLSYGRYGVNNLDVVPLTWSALDVQEKTVFLNTSGLRGIKGIHLPLANELTKLIPAGYKLLFVNVAYTGAAFIAPRGGSMDFDAVGLKPGDMGQALMWGEGRPYHKTLIARLKYALDLNPRNKLIGVVWCQGEADALSSDSHYRAFTTMAESIFEDLNRNNYGSRCPKGVADKDMWYTFSSTRYFVDWYDKQNAAPVFGGYKMWNPNTFIHVPRDTDDNSVGGNGSTGGSHFHFGNDAFRKVVAPAVAKCIDENGGLFNGKRAKGNRFQNAINETYANQYGGKMTESDVTSGLQLYMPFTSSAAEKIVGSASILRSGSTGINPASGLVDIYGKPRSRNALAFQKSSGKLIVNNLPISGKYSIAFMLKRTGSLGDELQTIISNAGATNAPFIGFRTYASGQRTANITEFVAEPLYTGIKAKAVPGMLLEADNVASLEGWIHYVVTYDHGSKECIVYMNGQEVERSVIANTVEPSLSKILIGFNSSTLQGFDGELIDLVMWNRVIGASTVKKVFLHSYYGFNK